MTRATTYFVKNLANKKAEAEAVIVEPLGNQRFAVTINGQRTEVDSLLLPQGAMSLLEGTHSYSVEFEETNAALAVTVRGQTSRFDVADERTMRLRAASVGGAAEGKQVIASPMPGKVVKVFVKVGDEVKEGQPVVVVEAMKMENELKSPKAGKVLEVAAVEGGVVENGAKLVVVE